MTGLASLRDRALEIALSQEGVSEHPPHSNDGPEVRAYLAAVGLGPAHPWCMAFMQWCYHEAAKTVRTFEGHEWVTTGSVHRFWHAAAPRWGFREATPGAIALHDAGHGLGHAGLVIAGGADGRITTIEGNSDAHGSRTGGSVVRQTRLASYWNLGFVDIGRGDP